MTSEQSLDEMQAEQSPQRAGPTADRLMLEQDTAAQKEGSVGRLWPARQAGSAGTAGFKTKRRLDGQTSKTGILRAVRGGERRRGAERGQQLARRMGCDP